MTFDIDAIAEHLDDDGATYTVGTDDGAWTFRLRIDHDEYTTVADVEDPEVFGRYEYASYGHNRDRSRPAGFTGAAVKIPSQSSQGDYFWYEPPMDLRRFKGSGHTTIESWEAAKALNLAYVGNLLSWGYEHIVVEVTHRRPDGYERHWSAGISAVESGTGLWGEPLNQHDRYVAELVAEQINDVIAEIEQEVPA